MKVIRVVCPKCDKEKLIKEDEQNIKEYQEELVSQRCPECRLSLTTEDKLLDAIFGVKESLNFW